MGDNLGDRLERELGSRAVTSASDAEQEKRSLDILRIESNLTSLQGGLRAVSQLLASANKDDFEPRDLADLMAVFEAQAATVADGARVLIRE